MEGLAPEDLSRLVLVSSPSASPNGRGALFVVSRVSLENNRYESAVWHYDGGSYYPLTSGPGDTCPTWSPDGSLVAHVRIVRQEGVPPSSSLVVRKPAGEAYQLFSWPFTISAPTWSPDGRRIAFLSRRPLKLEGEWRDYSKREALVVERLPPFFNGEGFIFDRPRNLYVTDSRGGQPEALTSYNVDLSLFDWSPDGQRIVYVKQVDEVRAHVDEVRLLDMKTGEDRQVLANVSVASVAWSPDGSRVAVLMHRFERGLSSHYGLYTLDPSTGSLEKVEVGLDRNLINGVNSEGRGPSCPRPIQWSGRWLYFTVHDAGRVWLYRADGKAVEPVLRPEDAVVDDYSVAPDGSVYYLQMNEREPNELYELRGGQARKVTDFNASLVTSRGLLRTTKATARAKDGTELDYWVLMPYGSREGKVPWMLYIHGGPKTSYGYGFMFTFHVLASAGIAVIFGNPRGSDGYTEEFADIRGRWGTVDYEDLMAIVDDALTRFPQLDPSRSAVGGGSYGGFMTNWVITHTSRFRAAVTERSCVEWYSDWGASDIGWYFDQDQLGSQQPWRSVDLMVKASPLTYIENATTPLLIMHALEDYRCPLSQALQLFTALKTLGAEVRMALFPGENHDLTRSGRPRARVEYLKVMLDWLTSHLR
ncbi:MAG: S9 family peptidase [Acidilobus sp.]